MANFLDFEKPIAELEGRIEELRHQHSGAGIDDTVAGLLARPIGADSPLQAMGQS